MENIGKRERDKDANLDANIPPRKRVAGPEEGESSAAATMTHSGADGQLNGQILALPVPSEYHNALEDMKQVKEYFKDDVAMYIEFRELMKEFKEQKIDIPKLIVRMKELFKDHREMLVGFNKILPAGYEMISIINPTYLEYRKMARLFIAKIRARSELIYKGFIQLMRRYRVEALSEDEIYEGAELLFEDEVDLLEEFALFGSNYPADSTIPVSYPVVVNPTHQQLTRAINTENILYEPRVRRPSEQSQQLSRMCEAVAIGKRKVIIDEFGQSSSASGAEKLDMDTGDRNGRNGREEGGRNKGKGVVKFTERNPQLELCNTSDAVPMRRPEQASQADLFSGFDWSEISKSDAYLERGRMNLEHEKCKDLERGRMNLAHERGKDQEVGLDKNIPLSTTRPQFTRLNLSKCIVVSPSYRLLPKDYKRLVTSYRTELAKSVLNDDCVLVPQDSRHFKPRILNIYEKVLFKCEDEWYTVDLYLERHTATVRRVIEYTLMLEDGKVEAVDTFFSAIHLKCMQTLFEVSRKELLEMLKESPTSRAMRVILSRLVQKVEEWTANKEEMNKVWKKMNADFFHLSLVHSSSSKLSTKKKSSTHEAVGSGLESEGSKSAEETVPEGSLGGTSGDDIVPIDGGGEGSVADCVGAEMEGMTYRGL